MNQYAPNPASSGDGPAALTASLLARKGEAMPAVDAEAHAGIDIAMRPMRPAIGPARGISQNTIQSLYGEGLPPGAAGNVRPFRPRPANVNVRRGSAPVRPRRPKSAPDEGGLKATVTFRMPAKDFVRLRFASRDLDMTCQSIILDAIDTYLDANDVAAVSDDACARETARLMQIMKKQRR